MTATNTKIPSDVRLVHRGRPVLITAQVAAFLGINAKRLQRLKSGNQHRFREGEHLHTIRGDGARAFREYANTLIPGLVAPTSCVLRLWLPIGVAQIARMLGGAAWDRYELLAQSPVLSMDGAAVPVPSVRTDAPMVVTAPGEPLVMSSREIAELCGKRHDHVMRDIEKMLVALEFDAPRFGGVYRDSKGEERPEYRLPKDLTLTLVSGYDVERRYRIVKRLEALEGGVVQVTAVPVLPALPLHEDWDLADLLMRAGDLRNAGRIFPDLAPRVAEEMADIERLLKTRETKALHEIACRTRIAAHVLDLSPKLCQRLDRMMQGWPAA